MNKIKKIQRIMSVSSYLTHLTIKLPVPSPQIPYFRNIRIIIMLFTAKKVIVSNQSKFKLMHHYRCNLLINKLMSMLTEQDKKLNGHPKNKQNLNIDSSSQPLFFTKQFQQHQKIQIQMNFEKQSGSSNPIVYQKLIQDSKHKAPQRLESLLNNKPQQLEMINFEYYVQKIKPLAQNEEAEKQEIQKNNSSLSKVLIVYHKMIENCNNESQAKYIDIQCWIFLIKEGRWITHNINLPNQPNIESWQILKILVINQQLFCFALSKIKSKPNYREMKFFKYNTNQQCWKSVRKAQQLIISLNKDQEVLEQKQCKFYLYKNHYVFLFIQNVSINAELISQYVYIPAERRLENQYVFVFSMKQLKWYNLTDNILMPLLSNISACSIKGRLYVYGLLNKSAQSEIFELEEEYFHENSEPTFHWHTILADQKPKAEQNNQLLQINKKNLLLINKNLHQYWIFDIYSEFWFKLQSPSHQSSVIRSICQSDNGQTIYLLMNGLNVYSFGCGDLLSTKQFIQRKFPFPETCEICYETSLNRNDLMQPGFKLSKIILDKMCNEIDFPFHAFALLADNTINYSASYLHFIYYDFQISEEKRYDFLNKPGLYIEDDCKLTLTNEDLQEVLVNFQGPISNNFSAVQRKTRGIFNRECSKKQFGVNIKLATFRLGSQSLFISVSPALQARIAYFTVQEQQCVCYYYVYDIKARKTVEGYSDEIRWQVQQKFQPLIEKSLKNIGQSYPKQSTYKNRLWILDLKKVGKSKEYEITPSKKPHDILYIPNKKLYSQIINNECPLDLSLDVSLFNFLSYMYIKNEHLKIGIKIESQEICSVNMNYIPQISAIIEKLQSSSSVIMPHNNSLYTIPLPLLAPLQLKYCSLYFDLNLNIKVGSHRLFHPGILIYYRNRLIKRYAVDFGTILTYLNNNPNKARHSGCFNIFGIIQVPDSMDINLFKNDFLHYALMEKLQKKLNYASTWVSRNYRISDSFEKQSPHGSTKDKIKLRSRVIQIEDNDEGQPEKKIKLSKPNQ